MSNTGIRVSVELERAMKLRSFKADDPLQMDPLLTVLDLSAPRSQ